MEKTISNINYWKEIDDEIPDLLKDMKGIVLLTHNSIDFTDVIDLLNKTRPGHLANILYISLIRSYDYIKVALDQKPLDNKRIFFIDCVSGFAFPSEDNVDECMYHKPPENLEQMKEIIRFGVEKTNPDIIVIDSLSQFINFSKPTNDELDDLYDFFRLLREDTLNIIQDTFILLYDNRMGMMQNLPKFSTDLILNVEVLKEEPRWRD